MHFVVADTHWFVIVIVISVIVIVVTVFIIVIVKKIEKKMKNHELSSYKHNKIIDKP